MGQESKRVQLRSQSNDVGGRVRIEFYTDPLCCWSWAFERSWQRLLLDYRECIEFEYVMCGMIEDWRTYHDPINAVSNPAQMGPLWMHASDITGVPMKFEVWSDDPPSSSYPACIAVKTMGLQSSIAETEYLYRLRKALMEDGSNIAKPEVLIAVAEQMDQSCFDLDRFIRDWKTGKGKLPFKENIKKARYHNVGRYPTLTFQRGNAQGLMIVGYRPYESLKEVLDLVVS